MGTPKWQKTQVVSISVSFRILTSVRCACCADSGESKSSSAAAAPVAPASDSGSFAAAPSNTSKQTTKRKRTKSSDAADAKIGTQGDKYERGTKFQAEWFSTFEWLDEDACRELKAFVCKDCTAANQPNCAFNRLSGGAYKDNVRRDKLQPHEDSVAHKAAKRQLDAMKTQAQTKVDSVPLLDTEKAELIKKAKMLMWMSAEEIAHAKFPTMCALHEGLEAMAVRETLAALKAAGVEIKESAEKAVLRSTEKAKPNLVSDYFVRQMLEAIATIIQNRILENVKKSPAVGVMVDDSTDDANIKQLSVVVRYAFKGEVRVAFLGLIAIPEGGAETVYTETAKLLADKGITVQQLLSFGSDGASAMTGTCFVSV
jgi:hypothetical protein